MEIELSSMWREIQRIINGDVKPVHYTYRAEIYLRGQVEPIQVLKLISVDTVKNYLENYADVIMVKVAMGAGTYAKRVYPNQSKLEMVLYKIPLMESSDVNDQAKIIQVERYTAVLDDRGNPIIEGGGPTVMDENSMNLVNLVEINFQLINKAVEQMRLIAVGGNYRNVTAEDVIRTVMTKESSGIDIDEERRPKGVDIVTTSNQKKRDHVVLPQGLRLVDLPEYLQNTVGVYSAGMGYYFHRDHWYVYPCYDTERFKKTNRTLTVFNVPKNKLPAVERTYLETGTALSLLATGDIRFRDDSEAQQLTVGNGVRFADANKFMENFATVKDNKAVVSRGNNNTEFIAVERPGKINNAQLSDRAITANPYLEYSMLARRQGSLIAFTWENSNPSLIFPGMPARVMYLEGDAIKTLEGVLLLSHDYTHLHGLGITAVRHITNSALYLFVKPVEEIGS